jgi:hypothetical protein
MRRLILISLLVMTALSVSAKQRFSYVYTRGSSAHISISKGSLEEILRLRKRYSGAYLWARIDGLEYLIRDAATLDEVRRAGSGLEALEPEQRALHNRMKPLERKEERLEDELDGLYDDDDEIHTVAERSRIRELEVELRAVERELKAFEKDEERLDRREEALERVFDAEVERIVERAVRKGVAERVN